MYLVFTRMPGESYHRRLRSLLLYLCYVFRALINFFVCWFFDVKSGGKGGVGGGGWNFTPTGTSWRHLWLCRAAFGARSRVNSMPRVLPTLQAHQRSLMAPRERNVLPSTVPVWIIQNDHKITPKSSRLGHVASGLANDFKHTITTEACIAIRRPVYKSCEFVRVSTQIQRNKPHKVTK